MTESPVLIVGRDSAIGKRLSRRLTEEGIPVVGTTRRPGKPGPLVDLAGDPADWGPLSGFSAAVLCAGETAVARCAADPEATRRINVHNTVLFARRLWEQGTRILYPSTSMVFDGRQPCPRADASPCPVTEYGRQKARAEEELLEWGGGVTILRMTKVVSPDLPLFRNWVGDLAAARPIRAFEDLRMAPVSLGRLADVLTRIISAPVDGILQISGSRDVTYLEAALNLASRLGAPPRLIEAASAAVAGIPESARPKHTALDTTILIKHYGFASEDPEAALATLVEPSQPHWQSNTSAV